MEDLNMVAADCVVISCCCQCLVLQILVFVFLQLPCRLVRKMKGYVMKKVRGKRRGKKNVEFEKDDLSSIQMVEELLLSSMDGDDCGLGCCMKEVEKVLGQFSDKGEFAFGSFWGRHNSGSRSAHDDNPEFDFSFVQFEFVEIVASLNCPEHSC